MEHSPACSGRPRDSPSPTQPQACLHFGTAEALYLLKVVTPTWTEYDCWAGPGVQSPPLVVVGSPASDGRLSLKTTDQIKGRL